jgi:hypothetical protein
VVALFKFKSEWRKREMIIGKDNKGSVISWQEQYVSSDKIVMVSVSRNFTTIATTDKKTGKVDTQTFLGKPPLPSAFSAGNK